MLLTDSVGVGVLLTDSVGVGVLVGVTVHLLFG